MPVFMHMCLVLHQGLFAIRADVVRMRIEVDEKGDEGLHMGHVPPGQGDVV